MVQLKPSSPTIPEPKPEYGYLSEIDPEFALLKDELDKRFAILWNLPLAELKTAYRNAPVGFPKDVPEPGKDYEVADQLFPVRDGTMIELRVYRPIKQTGNETLVLKAHGGGWVVGSHRVEEVENRMLAAKAGAVVASVDYRMAPEYPFPYAVNDCFDGLKWCKSHASELGINSNKIIVAGGSAGGNIAAALALMARDQNESGIIGQILNIPVICHGDYFPKDKFEYGSYDQNKDASVVDAPKMNWFWEQYMPEMKPEVYAHPLLAKSHAGLPPALIQVAGLDPLRDEGIAYANTLGMADVPLILEVYPGLPHGFYIMPHLKQTHAYWQLSVDFVKKLSSDGKLSDDWRNGKL